MGAKQSLLSLEDLDDFCSLTYFSRHDVLRLFDRFYRVNPEIVKSQPLTVRLPATDLFNTINELKYNPFQERLIQVFSSRKDACFSFDDFVDLASAFSEKSPADLRAAFAFRIYDFDNDGLLTSSDLCKLIDHLTVLTSENHLTVNELKIIVGHILEEAGIDKRSINEVEFQSLIKKLPDFQVSFKVPL